MPYPHYDAEFLLAMIGVGLLTAVVFPIAKSVPLWLGIPLAALPLVLIIVICVVFYRRTH